MTEQQERKRHIRAFMQAHYTDERLAQLLAHAQDGKLAFDSCCCFIGVPNAPHALIGRGRVLIPGPGLNHHCRMKEQYPMAEAAERAYSGLLPPQRFFEEGKADEGRRRILIPMIRAEQRRRDRLKQPEIIADAIIQETVNA